MWLQRARAESLEPAAISSYERHCRLHILPATAPKGDPNGWSGNLGDVKLSQLTTPLCETFRLVVLESNPHDRTGKIRTDKTVSRRMARHILSSFKGVVNEAQRRGLISHNPAQPVRINSRKRERVPIRIGEQIPDRKEVRAILTGSIDVWHTLYLTDAFTGMRSSELRGLVWQHVDLNDRAIEVRQRADTEGLIGLCKSEAAYRTIQIGDDLVEELRRWKLICPRSDLNLVFPDDDGNVLPRSKIYDELCAVQRRIGMKRPTGKAKYNVHSLRHFYASIMIDEERHRSGYKSFLGTRRSL